MIPAAQITGLVLCGGRGSRMGGVDKGLQIYRDEPLVSHALRRLGAQVDRMAINANRNLDAYAAFGVPVWADASPDFDGPLAGSIAGLQHCETPYLATVPCDSPHFPLDLIARLAAELESDDATALQKATRMAVAKTVGGDGAGLQPVFSLMHRSLLPALQCYMQSGRRSIAGWAAEASAVEIVFDDADAFFNANTLEELRGL